MGVSKSLSPAVTPSAQARTALVIGNAAYSADLGPLKNPSNDVTDMATTLRQPGFAVTLVRDTKYQDMAEAVEAFSVLGRNHLSFYEYSRGLFVHMRIRTGHFINPSHHVH